MLVRNDVNEPLLTTDVVLDETKAGRMGVTNAMVEATLATRYNSSGISLGTIWDGDYNYGVCLKAPMPTRLLSVTLSTSLYPSAADSPWCPCAR